MKAIRFFFIVFGSMLVVFLLVTGEIKRWIFGDPNPYRVSVDYSTDKAEPTKNLIHFDFYNVELGRRSFSIRAEFSQEDFQVESQIEDIRRLVFRDGVIEVPVAEEEVGTQPAAGPQPGAPLKNISLAFESATYQRVESDSGRTQFQVLLNKGKGVTNEGTEFEFEDLVFTDEALPGPGKVDSRFVLRSAKPVWVRNPSLAMMSPTGFESVMRSRGLETFSFLPPVSALIDTGTASAGADASAGEGSGSTVASRTVNAERTRVAVNCQGPLVLSFHDRTREGDRTVPARTLVKFQKDVVLHAVEGPVDLKAMPPALGNRFECQELEIELQTDGQKVVPRRALATWEGGRVRAVLHKEAGAPPYILDGERLQWILAEAPAGTAAPELKGAAVIRTALEAGEAVLEGRPTLKGPDMRFAAERAVCRLQQGSVLLEAVQGTLDSAVAPAREGRKERKATGDGWAPPRLEPWHLESAQLGGEPASPTLADSGSTEGAKERSRKLPEQWSMKADEVEFHFETVAPAKGAGVLEQRFTRFEARSRSADGVEIASLPASTGEGGPSPGPATPEPVSAQSPTSTPAPAPTILVTGKRLEYLDAEKKFTLEGTPDTRPRLARGDSWIEARRIHILSEEGTAWFEDEVKARLESLGDVSGSRLAQRSGSAAEGGAAGGAEGEPSAPGTRLTEVSFDVEAGSLTVRRDAVQDVLKDIWARGTPEKPVRVTSTSPPWFRLVGPVLYWDREKQLAQVLCLPEGETTPAPAGRCARVEFEKGELVADRIQFDHQTWSAYLSDQVTLRFSSDKDPGSSALEVSTPRATVEFFPSMEERGPESEGPFQHLRRVKSLHAYRSPERPIEIRGADFVGRAEECTWDSAARRLRFFGGAQQEIEVLRQDFRGPVLAREITYAEDSGLITLQGDVRGRILQTAMPTAITGELPESRPEPAAGKEPGDPAMSWQFETSTLEVQMQKPSAYSRVALESLRAKDKVYLRNEKLRVQLRGDDLVYDSATRKMRIFSPDGRPQTLLCDRFPGTGEVGAQPEAGAAAVAKVGDAGSDPAHKIVAQEIWLLLYENANAAPQRGEPREWLLVEFSKDVIASFYLPNVGSGAAIPGAELGDTWKMVAEKLTLHIDPSQPVGEGPGRSLNRLIPWAVASGKVIFASGSYQATAERAIYEDPYGRVTLIGSPARLSQENKAVEEAAEIVIRKVGTIIEYSPAGRQGRPALPEVPK